MRVLLSLALAISAIASVPVNAFFRRDSYPACATPCLTGNISYFGCSPTDVTCLCQSHPFLDQGTQCFYNYCTNPQDLENAEKLAEQTCEAAGVTVTYTYTPTQLRTQTSTATVTGGGNGTYNGTVTSTGRPTSPALPTSTTTSHNAAERIGSSTAAVFIGAWCLGILIELTRV